MNLNWFTTLSRPDGERGALHLLAREPSAHRRRVRARRRYRHGVRPDVPIRRSVLPAAECRRAHLAHADQGQRLDRRRATTPSRWAASGCTRLNDQVFRGFFTGRYIFGSVTGFLRYASPAAAGGFGPNTTGCSNGTYVTYPTACPAGSTTDGGPLLLYLQGAGRTGPATDAAGASVISNDEFSFFAQDSWQVRPNVTVNYGLRWDSQRMPETVDPRTTAYGAFLDDPTFPSDGTIPEPVEHVAAADRRGVGRHGRRHVARALELGRLLRASEHAEPGGIGHDQRPAAADDLREHRQPAGVRRADAHVAERREPGAACPTVSFRSSAASGCSIATTRTRTSSPSTSPSSSSSRPTGPATSISSGTKATI